MKPFSPKTLLWVAGLTSMLVTGCRTGYTAREVVVTEAPPAYVHETITTSPRPGYVWVNGDWVWRNGRWTWRPGHWMAPPRSGAVWHPGHYYSRSGKHYYRPGYWR